MKKKLIIEKCCNCPYFKRIAVKNGSVKAICFGRNKVYYLLNNTETTIPDDFIAGAKWHARQSIEVLSSVLENWVHGGDADCIIAEFEELLNK